jgi:hypothetical protein
MKKAGGRGEERNGKERKINILYKFINKKEVE